MGGEQSKQEGILKQRQFTVVGFKEDSRYGQFKLIDVHGSQYAMVTRTCQNYQEYCTLCAKLNHQKELNNIENMVKLVEVDTVEDSNLCSTFYKVTAVYEYFGQTLRDEQEFNLNSMKSLCNTLQQVYNSGSYHGNITPDNILVDNTTKVLKVNNILGMTGFNHYKRALIEECEWYLAPELLESLSRKELRPHFDYEKSDIYSLGCVALKMWGHFDMQSIYNKEQFIVYEDVLEGILEQFAQYYGTLIKNLVKQMLLPDPRMRPTFAELNQYLQPLQNFTYQEHVVETVVDVQQDVIDVSPNESPVKQSNRSTHQQRRSHTAQKQQQYSHHQSRQSMSPAQQSIPIAKPNNVPTIPSSPKEYYITGSISAQFTKMAEYGQQNVGTANFYESVEVLQERPLNVNTQSALTSQRVSRDTLPAKKSVKAQPQTSTKGVSLRRPKNDQMESKLPKKAVVASKRRC